MLSSTDFPLKKFMLSCTALGETRIICWYLAKNDFNLIWAKEFKANLWPPDGSQLSLSGLFWPSCCFCLHLVAWNIVLYLLYFGSRHPGLKKGFRAELFNLSRRKMRLAWLKGWRRLCRIFNSSNTRKQATNRIVLFLSLVRRTQTHLTYHFVVRAM